MKVFSYLKKVFFKSNEKYINCLFCGIELERSQRRYCSDKCNGAYNRYVKRYGGAPRKSINNAKLRGQWLNNVEFRNKKRAQQIANTIKKLERKCYFCEEEAKHRHHLDYNIPELIIPLCVKCHRRLHVLIDYKGGEKNAKRI